jgi:hypothetical protein
MGKQKLDVLEQFINLAMCNREINQHKAMKLWPQIEARLEPGFARLFRSEWNHFQIGHITSEQFAANEMKDLKEAFYAHIPKGHRRHD